MYAKLLLPDLLDDRNRFIKLSYCDACKIPEHELDAFLIRYGYEPSLYLDSTQKLYKLKNHFRNGMKKEKQGWSDKSSNSLINLLKFGI